MRGVVEGQGVEPEAVDGAAEGVAFGGCEEASVAVVCLPFFEGVDFFISPGYAAHFDDLLDQGF